jgi:hypothetical protein
MIAGYGCINTVLDEARSIRCCGCAWIENCGAVIAHGFSGELVEHCAQCRCKSAGPGRFGTLAKRTQPFFA